MWNVDVITRRLPNTFSVHQARCIQRTDWEQNRPVQVHVCTWSPASDACDYWLP